MSAAQNRAYSCVVHSLQRAAHHQRGEILKERQVALILDIGLEAEHQAAIGRIPFVVGAAVAIRLAVGHAEKPRLEAHEVFLQNALRTV